MEVAYRHNKGLFFACKKVKKAKANIKIQKLILYNVAIAIKTIIYIYTILTAKTFQHFLDSLSATKKKFKLKPILSYGSFLAKLQQK